MKSLILGMVLALTSTASVAGGLPADVANRVIVDASGQSPVAQLGMGDAKVMFGKFVTQMQAAHPDDVSVTQKGQSYIVKDKEMAFLFEAQGSDKMVIEKMHMLSPEQDVQDSEVSSAFALYLVNLGANSRKH